MKRYISIFLSLFFISLNLALAQDNDTNDVFLSLTKRSESIRDLPTNVSVVDSQQITQSGAKTLGDILTNELSFSIGNYGSLGSLNEASIRGSTAEQVLVLVDGVSMNNPGSGEADLSQIPLDNVEKIEIIRGGASAMYGSSAVGGVINIITKKYSAALPLLDFKASVRSYNTDDFSVGLNAKNGITSAAVTASKQVSDGYRYNSDFSANNFSTRLDFDLGNKGKLDFSGSAFNEDLGLPGPAPAPNANYDYLAVGQYNGSLERQTESPNDRQDDSKSSGRLEYSNNIGPGKLVATIYSNVDTLKALQPSAQSNTQYDSLVFGGEVKYLFNSGFTCGAEWSEQKYKQSDLIADATIIDNSRVNSAAYLLYKLGKNKLIVTPSIRFDNDSLFGSVFTPNLSAVYKFDNAFKLSLNAGQSWRAPTFLELYSPVVTYPPYAPGYPTYVTGGNTSLKPEKGTTADIGIAYEKDRYAASFTVFDSRINDMIIWQPSTNMATNTDYYIVNNVLNTEKFGTEVSLKHKISSYFSHELTYYYLWAINSDLKTLLDYMPRNTATYAFKYMSRSGIKAGIDFDYVSSQLTGDSYTISNPELPEYLLVNLKVSKKIKDVELWAKVDNATNKQYQTRLGYPLPGTMYYAGVTIKFWD